MTNVSVTGGGRVRVAAISVLNDDGVTDCVGVFYEPNTDEGWLVLTRDRALELAARLMVMADA